MADIAAARAAQGSLATQLDGSAWVRGIGIAVLSDGYGVRVNVASLADGAVPALPTEVDGVPVEVREVGDVTPSSP